MTAPIQYDSTKAPLQILGVMAVPTVVTIQIRAVGPGFREASDGRLPHVLYTTGLGMDTRPIIAEGSSYDEPLAYRFDASGTLTLPYLGTLYVVGGRGQAVVTVFARRSQERSSPSWPLPPQRWSLSQAANAGTSIRFAPPMGSESLFVAGSNASVELRYNTTGETYAVNNNDRLPLAGVSFVIFTPAARGMAVIRGLL